MAASTRLEAYSPARRDTAHLCPGERTSAGGAIKRESMCMGRWFKRQLSCISINGGTLSGRQVSGGEARKSPLFIHQEKNMTTKNIGEQESEALSTEASRIESASETK